MTAPASLPDSLVFVAAWLGLAGLAGWTAARALFLPGRPFRLERLGWGLAAGLAALAAGGGA
nr:hypothetical protein [Acidobacteriota bacterium]